MEKICLNCSERPAVAGSDTLPLCSECKAKVRNPRGVQFAPPAQEAPDHSKPME